MALSLELTLHSALCSIHLIRVLLLPSRLRTSTSRPFETCHTLPPAHSFVHSVFLQLSFASPATTSSITHLASSSVVFTSVLWKVSMCGDTWACVALFTVVLTQGHFVLRAPSSAGGLVDRGILVCICGYAPCVFAQTQAAAAVNRALAMPLMCTW